MQVAEKFISINGEGTHAGELAVFIRFQGCNLSCTYCDTAWANKKDCHCEEMSPEEIAGYIRSTGLANVTITGGEPLLQQDINKLFRILLENSPMFREEKDLHNGLLRVEVETNGSVDISAFCQTCRPVFTIDYKLPSSGCEAHMLTGNFDLLKKEDTVKFVCGSEGDLIRAKEVILEYGLTERCYVYLSPVFGKIEPARMVEYMSDNSMNKVRLQLQMHKVIWDPERRGV